MTAPRHWLVKSEPAAFSFDDLLASPGRTACWDGVRNYQARNFLRDEMTSGDLVLFYHSSAEPTAVVGIAEVVRGGYPDTTALDRESSHFDPKSSAASPTWYAVDIRAVEKLRHPLTLTELRQVPQLKQMTLLQKGSRLSVQPVTLAEFELIRKLGHG